MSAQTPPGPFFPAAHGIREGENALVDLILLLGIAALAALQPACYDPLEKASTDGMKGLLAVGVVVHHIAQDTQAGTALRLFENWGVYLVAGFFFISGYGLMVSLQKKGPAYLHGFLRRRLPGVAVPYLGAAVLFALVRTLALHQNLFARTLTDVLATSDTLVPFSWFIFAILYFYLLFDAAAHLGKSVPVLLAAAALGLVLYTVVLWRLGAGRWWFDSTLAFWLGLAAGAPGAENVRAFARRHFVLCLLGGTLALGALSLAQNAFAAAGIAYTPLWDMIFWLLRSGLFSLLLVLWGRRFCFSVPALRWLGARSLDLYLLQGLPMWLLRGKFLFVASDGVYMAGVLAGTLLLAWGCRAARTAAAKRLRALH